MDDYMKNKKMRRLELNRLAAELAEHGFEDAAELQWFRGITLRLKAKNMWMNGLK